MHLLAGFLFCCPRMAHVVKHMPLSTGYMLLQTTISRQIRSSDLSPVLPFQVLKEGTSPSLCTCVHQRFT